MDETGWLIEIATTDGAKWLTLNNNFTDNAFEALRFARKIDGDAAIKILALESLNPTVTEHLWIA